MLISFFIVSSFVRHSGSRWPTDPWRSSSGGYVNQLMMMIRARRATELCFFFLSSCSPWTVIWLDAEVRMRESEPSIFPPSNREQHSLPERNGIPSAGWLVVCVAYMFLFWEEREREKSYDTWKAFPATASLPHKQTRDRQGRQPIISY